MKCKVTDCNKSVKAAGFCWSHYLRNRRHGSPTGGKKVTPFGKPIEWVNSHIDHSSDDCLIWPFHRDRNGYARVRINGENTTVHSVMCRAVHGESPHPSLCVAHNCGNGKFGCVNPKHLRWDTLSANQNDRVLHGTSNRGEQCGTAKLSQEDVIFIWKSSETASKLANQFEVSNATIYDIRAGRTWGWLTTPDD